MTKAEKTKLYNRTRRGLISRFYNHQLERCRTRGHTAPTYSKDELGFWVNSQENFEDLFCSWENSGYLKSLKPSIDRLDDYKSYTLENIQLVTWEQNNKKKGREDTKSGKLHKATISIEQYTKRWNNPNSYIPVHSYSGARNR